MKTRHWNLCQMAEALSMSERGVLSHTKSCGQISRKTEVWTRPNLELADAVAEAALKLCSAFG